MSERRESLQGITEGAKSMVAHQLELAKAELTPMAKRTAVGGGMFGAAGVFALHALWMLLIAGALAVGLAFARFAGMGQWAAFVLGFVTVGVLSLLIAGVLALLGRGQFKRIEKPTATINELKATGEALSQALGKKGALPEPDEKPALDA